jgi:hypothetical protein
MYDSADIPTAIAASATGTRQRSETHVSPRAIKAAVAKQPNVAAVKVLPVTSLVANELANIR